MWHNGAYPCNDCGHQASDHIESEWGKHPDSGCRYGCSICTAESAPVRVPPGLHSAAVPVPCNARTCPIKRAHQEHGWVGAR